MSTQAAITQNIPKWINIYLWVVTILTILFTVLAYVKPQLQLKDWQALDAAGALSLAGPLGLYAARNAATVFIGLFALTQKSIPMIAAFLVLRMATESFDLINNLIAGHMPVVGFALVMLVIEVIAFMQIKKLL